MDSHSRGLFLFFWSILISPSLRDTPHLSTCFPTIRPVLWDDWGEGEGVQYHTGVGWSLGLFLDLFIWMLWDLGFDLI